MDDLLEVMIEFADFAQPRQSVIAIEEKTPEVLGEISAQCSKRQTRFDWKRNGRVEQIRSDDGHLTYILKNVLLVVLAEAKMGSEIEIDVSQPGALVITSFPGDRPEFAVFLGSGSALKGHYAGRSPKCFAFAAANLKRKYGPDWKPVYAGVIHQRLRSWGLNTIANWSDSGVFRLRRTPYTDNVGSHGARMIEGSEGYWGKFPDGFDPSFSNQLQRAMVSKRGGTANDPWCLGYFSDNEMSWGNETSLALGALKSPPDQAAKLEFIADLK